MMKDTGENKVAAALDDLLAYLVILQANNALVDLNARTIRKAIKALQEVA